MKTKEELNAIKEEVEALNKKLTELNEDELKQVVGGHNMPPIDDNKKYILEPFVIPEKNSQDKQYEYHVYKDLV